MRTNENIRMHEFIGLDAEVLQATCPTMVGMKGSVVDETRNTLRLRLGPDLTKGKEKKEGREIVVPKLGTVFLLRSPEMDEQNSVAVQVEGNGIIHRPEERIKRVSIQARKEARKGRRNERSGNLTRNDVHRSMDR